MIRAWSLAVLGGWLALTAAATAQPVPIQYRWQPGQILTYRFEQVTTVAEKVGDAKADSATKLNEIKRWQVLAVDAKGIATLQLSLASLRQEITTANGDVFLFDSAALDKSNPQLREQMNKYVGTPLAVLRIDNLGRVVEVKDCKFGPANRFESEPPFAVTLPAGGLQSGFHWERPFQITVEPPQGTGEKFQATQQFQCKTIAGGQAVINMATVLKTLPPAVGDQVFFLKYQPEGEVIFDVQRGILKKVQMKIDKELKGHQTEDSVYHFTSSYTEEYVGQ